MATDITKPTTGATGWQTATNAAIDQINAIPAQVRDAGPTAKFVKTVNGAAPDANGDALAAVPLSVRFQTPQKRLRFRDTVQVLTASQFKRTDASAFPTLYGPTIIKAAGKIDNPIDNYYMYVSTDHDAGAGGVCLATASTPTGTWTPYSAGATIFFDAVNGSSTETPDVGWDPDSRNIILWYQNKLASGTQATLTAVSPDGITFEIIGQALPTTSDMAGHTGYFRATRLGERSLIGISLLWPQNSGVKALWRSFDGYRWELDWRYLARQTDSSLSQTRKIDGPNCFFQFDGELWGGTSEVIANSGGSTTDSTFKAGPLSDDMRTFKRPPDVAWQPSLGESSDVQGSSVFVDDDGIPYFCFASDLKIFIAKGELY